MKMVPVNGLTSTGSGGSRISVVIQLMKAQLQGTPTQSSRAELTCFQPDKSKNYRLVNQNPVTAVPLHARKNATRHDANNFMSYILWKMTSDAKKRPKMLVSFTHTLRDMTNSASFMWAHSKSLKGVEQQEACRNVIIVGIKIQKKSTSRSSFGKKTTTVCVCPVGHPLPLQPQIQPHKPFDD